MEFKEAMKTRKRMCDYYSKCKDCPLFMLDSCLSTLEEVNELDEYEKILEEWAKEHPVVTNADKLVEAIKNTYGGTKLNKKQVRMCVKAVVGLNVDCNTTHCSECMKWWDKEYKEPEKEKEE